MFYVYQFLRQIAIVDILISRSQKFLLRQCDNVRILTILHNCENPFEKSIYFPLVPLLQFTINFLTYRVSINKVQLTSSPNIFYETYYIHDNNILQVISNHSFKKLTEDFYKINMLCVKSNNKVLRNLNNLYTDFDLTAFHICCLLQQYTNSIVECVDNNLDEFTFKNTDLIKSI